MPKDPFFVELPTPSVIGDAPTFEGATEEWASLPTFFLPRARPPRIDPTATMERLDLTELRRLTTKVVEGLGYDLVELEWKHEAVGWVLRVFIDKEGDPVAAGEPPRSPIGFDDCERASRTLSAELDVADAIPVAYHLEVSSPGLDRPLRRERDFRRFVGHLARIRTLRPLTEGGATPRRNFRGRLAAVDGGRVRIEVDGLSYEIPIDEVEKANLEYEFKS